MTAPTITLALAFNPDPHGGYGRKGWRGDCLSLGITVYESTPARALKALAEQFNYRVGDWLATGSDIFLDKGLYVFDRELNVLCWEESKFHFAQVLEHQMCAKSRDIEMTEAVLVRCVEANFSANGGSLDHLEACPQKYWDRAINSPAVVRGLETNISGLRLRLHYVKNL